MELEVLENADAVARKGAAIIAGDARQAVTERGLFIIALSGGQTPWKMLRALSAADVPWAGVHIVQVDERAAPEGDRERNMTHLQESLLAHVPIRQEHVHPMPVGHPDLRIAAGQYARTLQEIAGFPAVPDLVHLGLGSDGHTASLIPGDPVLDIQDADVAATGVYQGRRRLTLTYPILNRSRRVLWIVTGIEKKEMLSRLYSGDSAIPAGRIERARARIIADGAAAQGLNP